MTITRREQLLFGLGVAASPLAAFAQAREVTASPLKFIVPFSAGSGTDVIARLIAKALSEQLRRTVLTENKPGGAGAVAAMATLAEPADGNTVLFVSSAFAVLPVSGKKLAFNPEVDFDALAIVARSPNVLIASHASRARTVGELVAAGKAKSDGLTFASSGIGSGTHLNAEYFASVTGIQALHIPMRGGPEILAEIISGRVDFAFVPPSQISAQGAGKFMVLGVTGKTRVATLPTVPTISEAGFAGFEYQLWYAALARAGAPAATTRQLAAALAQALSDPSVASGFQALAIEPVQLVAGEARTFIRDEIAKNQSLVRSRQLQLNDTPVGSTN